MLRNKIGSIETIILSVGDTILFSKNGDILQGDIIKISPSKKHVLISADSYISENGYVITGGSFWIRLHDVLENLEVSKKES